MLTFNITIGVTMLMVSMYIPDATKIASFPTILLITTLYRLALEVSATRLILLQADAGHVIRAFGEFVVGGNYVVGAVIFLILALIQFIVITKGAERVAEVSARFTLDAMPGRQMSIDADVRAGVIDINEARRRRSTLQRESQLYGSMDGAMKFVKGDAIAGIIIALINIIGGLAIGALQRGMPLIEAVQTYTILTIGEGLVAQIPALLISVSAGMVVTRVSSEEPASNLGRDIGTQVLAQPKALAIASGLLACFGFLGLPIIPFLTLSAVTGGIAYGLFRTTGGKARELAAKQKGEAAAPAEEPRLSITIPLVLEVSKELTPYVDLQQEGGQLINDLIPKVREALYYDLGVIFPSVQVKGNSLIQPNTYIVRLKEVPVSTGAILPGHRMVDDNVANLALFGLNGTEARNPANGRPAAWIPTEQKAKAEQVGLHVWGPAEIMVLHLSGVMRRYAAEFLGLQEVQSMLDLLSKALPALVEEVVPKIVSLQQLTDILQRLVQEEISIRDLKSILQTLGDWGRMEKDTVLLTEYVRSSLKRYISFKYTGGAYSLIVYLLDPEIEDVVAGSIRRAATGTYLAIEPEITQEILAAMRRAFGNLPATAQPPVIVTNMEARRFVRKLVELEFPHVAVISYQELTPEINVQPIARISLSRRAARAWAAMSEAASIENDEAGSDE